MITTIVSAIGGPILSVVSGWLGGSGKLWKWPRNLVSTLAGMPGIAISPSAAGHAKDGVFGRYPSFIVREWFAEQWSGDKTWAHSMCGLRLGFWVEDIGAMGHAARLEFKAQMGLDTLVPYRYQCKFMETNSRTSPIVAFSEWLLIFLSFWPGIICLCFFFFSFLK